MERRRGNGNLSNKFSSCHTRLISISHSISLKTFLFSKQAVGHEGIQLEGKTEAHILPRYMRHLSVLVASVYRTAFILCKGNVLKK